MKYDKHDTHDLDNAQDQLKDEMVFAERARNNCIPLPLTTADMLSSLLMDLADIAMRAPGGHGYQIDEANLWAMILKGKN